MNIDFERLEMLSRLGDEVVKKRNTPERWGLIRRMYAEHMPAILEAGDRGVDPYFTDWVSVFTPIEMDAWQSIRGYGVPLYPQFPVLNFFIDFANPVKRIGIEMDGAQWHDEEKDRRRDLALLEEGWTIFRVPGRQAYTRFTDPFDNFIDMTEEERARNLENWFMNSSDGVIYAIKEVYFSGRIGEWHDLARMTLADHCLIGVA